MNELLKKKIPDLIQYHMYILDLCILFSKYVDIVISSSIFDVI